MKTLFKGCQTSKVKFHEMIQNRHCKRLISKNESDKNAPEKLSTQHDVKPFQLFWKEIESAKNTQEKEEDGDKENEEEEEEGDTFIKKEEEQEEEEEEK